MAPRPASVPLPALITGPDGVLRSAQFDDVYASRQGGAEETRHVFLAGNGLPQRWQSRARFTIGELGFGTGLNFLVTWRAFLEHGPKTHRLHYIAFEQYPLTPAMLRAIHGEDALAAQLIARYPLRLPGTHRVEFERVTLTLCIGDARSMLPQLAGARIDAWYLDGFAPAKNPELWGADLFLALGAASAPDATAATYSAAAVAREGLACAGFTVEKRKGFAYKRDMLVARRGGAKASLQVPKNIAVIGGGIAGCSAVRALAERGHRVTLLEKHRIAGGASGNEAAVLYPPITKQWITRTAWYFTGYGFTLRMLARWREMGLVFASASPGMVKLPSDADDAIRLAAVNDGLGLDPAIAQWLEHEELMKRAGSALPSGGVWYNDGTWLAPAQLCRALLQHPNITLQEVAAVTSIEQTAGGWRVNTSGAVMEASHVIICNAQGAAHFLPSLKIGRSAGQVTLVPASAVREPLSPITCRKGYIVPQGDHYLLGATYDHDDFSGKVTEANHAHNKASAREALPGWLTGEAVAGGRTSLRATTPDRMPYIGEVEPGLYVSTGHGSRGMISAPLAAEMIASWISEDALPLSAELVQAVSPARFQTESATVSAKPSRLKTGA